MARPVSLLTSLLLVVAVILVVIFIVAPELGKTFVSLEKQYLISFRKCRIG